MFYFYRFPHIMEGPGFFVGKSVETVARCLHLPHNDAMHCAVQ